MIVNELKRAAGYRAAELVTDGMAVGLGSGSTARFATLRIAERLRSGSLRNIVAIPTSNETACLARQEGIPLTTLERQEHLDVTIDGADEVDGQLDVIKGLGGYLLREKIVAYATCHEVIVVDDTKMVDKLGTRAPVPVEVIRFGWQQARTALERTDCRPEIRMRRDKPYVTDEGNYILDCYYEGGIDSPRELAAALDAIPGVVEHGLFLGLVKTVVVAMPNGVRIIER